MQSQAIVILPTKNNAGESLACELTNFRRVLMNQFGAECFSEETERGKWKNHEVVYNDIAIRFTILADWDMRLSPKREKTLADRLESIAADACRAFDQEAVFVRHGNGQVIYAHPADAAPPQSVRLTWAQRIEQSEAA
jgi:hypothetical protein